jgi:hypothetical protein
MLHLQRRAPLASPPLTTVVGPFTISLDPPRQEHQNADNP